MKKKDKRILIDVAFMVICFVMGILMGKFLF